MDTKEPVGAVLQGGDEESRREAARTMGSARTPKKSQSSAANIARANEQKRLHGVSEETKEKLRAAQAARRERERQDRLASVATEEQTTEKKPRGRPRTKPPTEAAEKRPVGRPKKQNPEGTP